MWPVQETIKILNKLKKKHELFIATARPQEMYRKTWQQCIYYFGIVPVFTTNKHDFCWRIGAHMMVEDNRQHAMSCAEKGRRVFLFNKRYNERPFYGSLEKLIIRVDNLHEVVEWIN